MRVDFWRPTPGGELAGEVQSVQVTMGRLSPETNMEPLVASMRALGLLRLATFTEAEADEIAAILVPLINAFLAE